MTEFYSEHIGIGTLKRKFSLKWLFTRVYKIKIDWDINTSIKLHLSFFNSFVQNFLFGIFAYNNPF